MSAITDWLTHPLVSVTPIHIVFGMAFTGLMGFIGGVVVE